MSVTGVTGAVRTVGEVAWSAPHRQAVPFTSLLFKEFNYIVEDGIANTTAVNETTASCTS